MKTSRPVTSILFDLDGTLVDSAPGIVESLTHAFAACGIEPPRGDWARFIGPPLPQMLATALPSLALEQREAVIAAYRAHYGAVGLFETVCYPGTSETLAAIAGTGRRIYVVTNKPQQPAEAVITHLGLDAHVHRIVGGDPTGRISKPERAAILAQEEKLTGGIFLGDGLDDLLAAERIGAAFLLAGWGYGTDRVLKERPDVSVLAQPRELLDRLAESSRGG
jgi:phosphoglycolate phosphatase